MPAEYAKKRVNGKTESLHRVIARAVGKGYNTVVDHRDGNKRNNAPSNLKVMSRAAHNTKTHLKHPKTKRCPSCGKTFMPAPTHRERAVTCGRPECISRYLSRKKSAR